MSNRISQYFNDDNYKPEGSDEKWIPQTEAELNAVTSYATKTLAEIYNEFKCNPKYLNNISDQTKLKGCVAHVVATTAIICHQRGVNFGELFSVSISVFGGQLINDLITLEEPKL